MNQFSLHCVNDTAELNIAFAPTHERPEQSQDNKILSLRVADLVANDSVRSITDDRRKTTTNEEGTITADGRSETHAVPLFGSGALLHMISFLWLSRRICAFFIFSSSQQKALVGNRRLGHLVHALFFGIQ